MNNYRDTDVTYNYLSESNLLMLPFDIDAYIYILNYLRENQG